MANEISTAALKAEWNGKDRWLTDGGARGAGRLVALIRKSGAEFRFQHHTDVGGKRYLMIGAYDPAGRRGISLVDARFS